MIIGEFTETYPPMLDGVGRAAMAYCEKLEEMGHTAWYICPDDAAHTRLDSPRTLLYGGIPIPGQNYRIGTPDLSPAFKKKLLEIPFDVLHIHSPFLSAHLADLIRARRPDVPVIATFHSKYYDDFLKVTHSKKIAQAVVNHIVKVYNRCDAVWTVNEGTADVLKEYGYQGPIRIAPNGTDLHPIDRAKAAEKKKSLGLKDDTPVLLFVGQVDRKKNIHSILQACAFLKKESQKFELLIVGKGPDQDNLKKLTVELGLSDNVHFLGFVSDTEELRSIYTLSDLFVFPSVYDNAPMVIREAAANGTPSLLVRGSCSAGIVEDGVNGFLCENTPEDIARGIREALSASQAVGLKARETIPQPWDKIIGEALEQYQYFRDIKMKAGSR